MATSLGVIFGLVPFAAAIALGLWLAVLFASGYVSLASIIATISVPDNSRCRGHAVHQFPRPRPVGRSVKRSQPTLDDLPGAFCRGFVVRRIDRIVTIFRSTASGDAWR